MRGRKPRRNVGPIEDGLHDVSQEKSPTVVAIAPTGQNPEGVKFVRRGGDLFVLTANEASGTVSVLRVER